MSRFHKETPSARQLQRARDEFRELLECSTKEVQWQKFFSDNPFVLSFSLPVRLAPDDIIPARPGVSEPDFIFYAKQFQALPTYGVIELKRPDSKIITVTRSNAAILSRDAETAIQPAADFSTMQQNVCLMPIQDRY